MKVHTADNTAPQQATEYTVATGTATAVATSPTVKAKQKLVVQSLAANTVKVYVGGTGVATTTGIELAPGDSVTFDGIEDPSRIFAIAGSGGQKLHIVWW
jgi:hypothetical protein